MQPQLSVQGGIENIGNMSSTLQGKAKVKFDFPGTKPGEMKLTAGETIDIVVRGPQGGWSKGLRGSFPTDYIEFIANQGMTPLPSSNMPQQLGMTSQSPYKPPMAVNSNAGMDLLGMGNVNVPPQSSTLIPNTMNRLNPGAVDLLSLDLPTTTTATSSLAKSTGNDLFGLNTDLKPTMSTISTAKSNVNTNVDLLSMGSMSPMAQTTTTNSTHKNFDIFAMDNPTSTTNTMSTALPLAASAATATAIGNHSKFDAFAEIEKDPTPSLFTNSTINTTNNMSASTSVPAVSNIDTATKQQKPVSTASSLLSAFSFSSVTSSSTTAPAPVATATTTKTPSTNPFATTSSTSSTSTNPFSTSDTRGDYSSDTQSYTNTNNNNNNTNNNNTSNFLPPPPPLSQLPQKFAIAKFDRDGQGPTELSIKKGINIIKFLYYNLCLYLFIICHIYDNIY